MRRYHLLLVLLAISMIIGCSREKDITYTINQKEDVIDSHGITVYNLEKLDAFIHQTNSTQRVVHYTIEGDPIFNDLSYNDNKVIMRYDTTQDKNGAPEIKTYICAKLEKADTDNLLEYTLTGCDGDRGEIEVLQIPFDVMKQDRFEFDLKYGVNQKNEINTINGELVKDLQNGTIAEVSDFQLSNENRQQIYKEMVLANYLGEKQLSTRCNRKPYVSYDLTVSINGGSRHYQWTECDSSKDGRQMTELAKAVIDIVQAEDVYKQLPAVKGYYE